MADIKTPLSFYLRQKKEFLCLNCTLPICAESDSGCIYRNVKPDALVEAQRAFGERAKLKTAIANLGFKKYDGRRKPDTPQRMLWRVYKEKPNENIHS